MFDFWDSFWKKFTASWNILVNGTAILFKHPILILPILITWIIYAAIIIYFEYYFDFKSLTSLSQHLALTFGIIMIYCFILSISSLMMLEFVQQLETGKKINLVAALNETICKDLIKALPIMLVWGIIWFILEILTPKRKRRSDSSSAKSFARTLSGSNEVSLIGLSMDLIKSGVRLIVFLIYPAIAWEDEGPINAVKKGFRTIKQNPVEFTSGFIQIEFVMSIIAFPAGMFLGFADANNITLSEGIWILVIIYIAFSTSVYLYLQQMFTAILYMWNMNWERAYVAAKMSHQEPPTLYDIKKPDLMDNIADLNL